MPSIFVYFRQRRLSGKGNVVDGARRVKVRDGVGRAVPAPEANAEIPANLNVCDLSFCLYLILVYYIFVRFLSRTLSFSQVAPWPWSRVAAYKRLLTTTKI